MMTLVLLCGVEVFLFRLFVNHYFKYLKGIYYLKEKFYYKGKNVTNYLFIYLIQFYILDLLNRNTYEF